MVNIRAIENSVPEDLYPALAVMRTEANKSKSDTFKMGPAWKNEIEALAKAEFTFKVDGVDHTDNLIKFSQDSRGDFTCKFSPYLPQDESQIKQYGYSYKKPAYAKPTRPGKDPLVKDVGGFVRIAKMDLPKCDKGNCVDVVKVDPAKNIVYGVVLVPGLDNNAQDIEDMAHNYATNSRLLINEDGAVAKVQLVENCIAPINDYQFAGQKIKKGSWLVVLKINDANTMSGIKDSCLRIGA